MRHVLSAAFLLALSACAQPPIDPRAITGIDPVFDHYIEVYKAKKGRGLDYDISIQLADLDRDIAGLCRRWGSGHRQIEIDRDYWENRTNELEKMTLIAHELGHCDLNLHHNNNILPSGMPESFMYWRNFGYPIHMEDYYFSRLFDK